MENESKSDSTTLLRDFEKDLEPLPQVGEHLVVLGEVLEFNDEARSRLPVQVSSLWLL